MKKAVWSEGVSKTSIGRFGSIRGDLVPPHNGYLTCNTKLADVFLQERGEQVIDLGYYVLPEDFAVKSHTDWVGKRHEFTTPEGAHSTVFRSLLFPGFLYRIKTGVFAYNFRVRNHGPQSLVLPLKSGLKHVHGTQGYDRKRDGDLAKPWVFAFFADTTMPFDYPMQFVFDKQPEKIEVWSHEMWQFHFKSKTATVAQIHPFGAEQLDKKTTALWKKKVPAAVEKRLDFWAAAAMAYPVGCKETFKVDVKKGVVAIRNEYTYETSKSEWGTKPLHLAPLPPILANAKDFGYAVKVKGKVMEKICPTFQGYYEAVKGTEIEYELPLSRFRNHTLAPVAIKNDKTADIVTEKLTSVLESGKWMTFSGDDHYDPECSMDSLHNLRIMAWALWSIAPEKRAKVLKFLTAGLTKFSPKEYIEFVTPFAGTKWVRDKSIFDYLGIIDYDMEWYNGMNMAGLWNCAYYTDDPRVEKIIKEKWGLIEEINNYTEAYMDWSLSSSWTMARGEHTWLDGINYTYEGLLAFAAMARRIGNEKDAEWGDYLAAKVEAFIANCWTAAPYAQKYSPSPNPEMIAECSSGFFECRLPGAGDHSGWSCGSYSYLVREIFVLLRDLKKQEVTGKVLKKFAEKHPHWRNDPYRYGKASGYPGSDPRRTIHHYFLDPRLMLASLVLGEDVKSLLKGKALLTAPVLECFLVSMAPKVLVPRDVKFLGSVWDAKAKTLTVTLGGKGTTTLGLAHSAKPKNVVAKKLGRIVASEGRIFYTVGLEGATEIVFSW